MKRLLVQRVLVRRLAVRRLVVRRLLAAGGVALTLALGACNDQAGSTKSLSPIPPQTVALMSEKGMSKADPILVRLYKKESELELWKRVNGQYALLKTFPICRWSGQLGPKTREGDRQAPEGFYTVTPGLMNPNSSYYLSFDTGYPNAFDRAHARTGSQLMVHGNCSSRGCYAMTDEGISEVYAIAREAFSGGQRGFQLQAYPFRMTAENLARYRQDPNMAFWKNLKQGADHFEVTRREPKVSVCERRYAFNTVGDGCKDDPTLAPAVAQKDDDDRRQVADLVAKGTPAVRLVYSDGGQHDSFKPSGSGFGGGQESGFAILDSRPRRNLGDVSRPDALAEGPREVATDIPAPKSRGGTALAARSEPTGAARTAAGTGLPRTPARTVLANADEDATLPTRGGPAEPSLYGRLLSNVLGSAAPEPESAARTASSGLAASSSPSASSPPAPPRRRGAETAAAKPTGDTGATPARPKPRASADSPTRHAEASRLMTGSQPIGPSATAFKAN